MINEIAAFFLIKGVRTCESLQFEMDETSWCTPFTAIIFLLGNFIYLLSYRMFIGHFIFSMNFLFPYVICIHFIGCDHMKDDTDQLILWMCRRLIESYACNYNLIYNWQFFPDEQIHSTQRHCCSWRNQFIAVGLLLQKWSYEHFNRQKWAKKYLTVSG